MSTHKRFTGAAVHVYSIIQVSNSHFANCLGYTFTLFTVFSVVRLNSVSKLMNHIQHANNPSKVLYSLGLILGP